MNCEPFETIMLLFFIIISISSVAVAQQSSFIFCDFDFINAGYGCRLQIENPNNWNNFTEINGIHRDGFTNSNVTAVYCHRCQGQSTIIPSIICDTFPNLSIFEYALTKVTEIDDNSLRNCSRLTELVLRTNMISSITSNAFINLRNVNNIVLTENLITNLPENVFSNQQSLTTLRLRSNVLEDDIPISLLWPLENLQVLDLIGCNLNVNINGLLGRNTNLKQLLLNSNRFTLFENSFVGLEQLEYLHLWNNSISQIPIGTFASTPNIRELNLQYNNFTELSADTFTGLELLTGLFIGFNPIERIDDRAFQVLENLDILDMFECNLSHLNSSSIRMLRNLTMINVAFNRIEQLEQSLFASIPNLIQIDLSNNRLKTLNRNSFGNLTNLRFFYLRGNELNEVDRAIIDEAWNLNLLDFESNLCADASFTNFMVNRSQYLPMLETCFSNFEHIEGKSIAFHQHPNEFHLISQMQ